jgi:outer membrane protein
MFRNFGIRLTLVSAAMLAAASAGLAQSKVAVINLQRAVLESAEIKKASAEMEAKYKPRQAEIEKLQKEIQSIQTSLQSGKLNPIGQQDAAAQGQRKQRELTRITEDLQADVQREREEILSRSTDRMQKVVTKLAEEKGFDIVVDINNTVYFKTALEITTESIAAYDKAHPPK